MTATDSRSAPERILEAAERLFALQGYHGVSIREIAAASQVALNLVRYHFGSKDDLFRAVSGRRLDTMCTTLIEALENARPTPESDSLLSVHDIVNAYAVALDGLNTSDPGWNHYLKLIINADRLVDRPELLPHLRETYEPVFDLYAQAFEASGMSKSDASWAIYFMHTSVSQLTQENYSISRLSRGLADPSDHGQFLPRLVGFISNGLQALSHG